jgi:hypothetical protein
MDASEARCNAALTLLHPYGESRIVEQANIQCACFHVISFLRVRGASAEPERFIIFVVFIIRELFGIIFHHAQFVSRENRSRRVGGSSIPF